MRAPLYLATAICLLCASPPVHAQEPVGIALLSLEISGDGPAELRQQLQEHILLGLRADGASVVGLEQLLAALKETPELIGCSSSACLERITELVSAERFVRAVVTANGANYEIRLDLLGLSEEQPVENSVSESCAVCTIAELTELTSAAAKQLLSTDVDTLLTVTIASTPPGAAISIDGEAAGRSPLSIKLKAGEHQASATLEGYTNSEKTITVLSGTDEQRFELPLTSAMAIVADSGGKDFGPWKWAALAGSGAFLILGTTLVVIDGDPACDSTESSCRELNNTMVPGVLSLSAGVLAGAAVGWMFWEENKAATNKGHLSLQLDANAAIANFACGF